jgi:hypothetical protein
MQFDINLGANKSQHLDVSGTFLKYKSGTGPIRVRLNGGGYIDLVPGQGVSNVKFDNVDVQDRSGLTNTGTILAGNYDFRDDNVNIGGGSLNLGEIAADMYQSNWTNTAAMTAGQVIEIVSAAANVRGIRVHQVIANESDPAGGPRQSLLAKLGGTPPNNGTASESDPGVEMIAQVCGKGTITTYERILKLVVPPGRALYWQSAGVSGTNIRNVKYTVL